MPLSKAEKQKRYRERLKEKGKHEEVKEKDRSRKNAKRKSLTPADLKTLQKAQPDSQRKHRAMNPDAEKNQQQPPRSPESYHSVQTLGKAMKHAELGLPYSPRKRRKVLGKLVKKYSVHSDDDLNSSFSSSGGSNRIAEETQEKVAQFYCRDDISWQSPNRKDKVSVTTEDGVEDMQKRFMVMTLAECHALYIDENPNNYVGLSKFCSLRPLHVSLVQDFPHTLCVCKYHENVRLLLECLHKNISNDIPIHFYDFLKTIVCDQEKVECMFGECGDCNYKTEEVRNNKSEVVYNLPKFEEVYNFPEQADMKVEWLQWKSVDGRATKTKEGGKLKDCVEKLKDQLPAFLKHTFVKRKQSRYFESEKAKVDGQYAVVQVDFAENFAIIHQNEIQAGHWNHQQVTIFTACAYVGDKVQSYAIVSDDLVHGKYAVARFTDYLISELKKTYPELAALSFFSDGAGSQFKNRYLFENITYMKEAYHLEKLTWNFFATSHGKGVVDGIGGQVKRVVHKASKIGAFVEDARTFAEEAKKNTTNIKVVFIPAREISDGEERLDEVWRDVNGVSGTLSIHIVEVVKKHVVQCALFEGSTYEVFAMKGTGVESDNNNDQQATASTSDTLPAQPEQVLDPKRGDYVVIQYVTERSRSMKYVAQITEMKGNDVQVTHFYKKDREALVFILKERTDTYGSVSPNQIVKVLPTPAMDNKERLHFPEPIPEAN